MSALWVFVVSSWISSACSACGYTSWIQMWRMNRLLTRLSDWWWERAWRGLRQSLWIGLCLNTNTITICRIDIVQVSLYHPINSRPLLRDKNWPSNALRTFQGETWERRSWHCQGAEQILTEVILFARLVCVWFMLQFRPSYMRRKVRRREFLPSLTRWKMFKHLCHGKALAASHWRKWWSECTDIWPVWNKINTSKTFDSTDKGMDVEATAEDAGKTRARPW